MEKAELIFEVFDYNTWKWNTLIGTYSIGLSTMYRHCNHEFHKVWLRLFDPENPSMCKGYLQVSGFIVGPNERPPVHGGDDLDLEKSGENDDQIEGADEQ